MAVAGAAGMGLPVVRPVSPACRQLGEGVPIFSPPPHPESMAFTLDPSKADPHQRPGVGKGARRRSRRFTAEAQAEAMLAIYEGLVRQPVTSR